MPRGRRWPYRILSIIAGGSAFLLLAELGFRILLPVSDIPYWIPDSDLGYRHAPRLEGRFVTNQHTARFRLNNRGWNNPRDYGRRREPGESRIAVIGDSFVEALQVDVGRGLGPVLERLLAREGCSVEVFTYGISGASTAYALRLLQGEVSADRPDIVVYLFIDNDVADNVAFLGSAARPGPHFDLNSQGELRALPTVGFRRRRLASLVNRSAVFRYFWINRGMGTAWQERRSLASGPGSEKAVESSPGGVYDAETESWMRAWTVTGKLIASMRQQADRIGAELLVVNRPHPALFYDAPRQGDIRLPEHHLVALARSEGFTFVDLEPWFRRDWETHSRHFDYPGDAHWNERGQEVAAQAVKAILQARRPELFGGSDSGKDSAP